MRDPAERRDPTALVLAGCGGGLAVAFGAIVWLGDLTEHPRGFVALLGLASACYGLAVAWVIRRPPARRAVLGGIFAAAVGFRLIVLPMVPTLSTDVYRYVWDGRLTIAGVDPYRHPPDAPEIAAATAGSASLSRGSASSASATGSRVSCSDGSTAPGTRTSARSVPSAGPRSSGSA